MARQDSTWNRSAFSGDDWRSSLEDPPGDDLFRDFEADGLSSPPCATATEEPRTASAADSYHGLYTEFLADSNVSGEGPARPAPGSSKRRAPEIPGYEILEELGRGAMGVVYKARQVRLNRLVALKMILAGDHAGPDALRRFLAEAETIARMQHPNIVQIYAIGDCEGRPYVELEFVEGGSLASRLDGTPWPPRAAARLIESLARAVADAHRLDIVHRDLKPANVLMTSDGEPKVSDFGLAKSLHGDSALTRTESVLGSPCYMAPEQADGGARDVGTAADIYALGANLYELLTGRPPFVAPTVLATLEMVKNSEPVPPRRLQPNLARDLDTICLKCLAKEPHKRYESADTLADDLARYLGHMPILARPTPKLERVLKWVRRRPAAAALVAVSTLALLGSATGGAWYRSEVARQGRALHARVEGLRGQADQFVTLGREAMGRKDWEAARTQMSSALALLHSEPLLAEPRAAVEDVLKLCGRKVAESKGRAAARARFADFQRLRDEAVFHQSDYTGLDPEANLRATRSAARRALETFAFLDTTGWGPKPDPSHFDAAEVEEITSIAYELTLILAEVVAQPLPEEVPAVQAREALAVLEPAARLRPPTPVYHLRKAVYLEKLGDTEGAGAQRGLAETATGAGDSAVDYFLAGEQAYRKHDLKRAAASFGKALSIQPDHFWAQYLLGVCHLKAHRPAEAQAALIACQSRRPGFVWAYLLKGFAEGEMSEFDLAEADFQKATELGLDDQKRYVMLVNRGVMRIRRGNNRTAADDLNAAVDLKPDQFQAYINLGQAYQNLGRWDDAVATLDRAIARSPRLAVLYRARGQVHRKRGKDREALADMEQAVALAPPGDPSLAGDHVELGLVLQQAGRFREALAAGDRALEARPGWPDAHRLRGVALVGLKRYGEAVLSLDVCVDRGVPTQAIYEARGLAETWCGAYPRAVADFTMALSKGEPTASLLANRGWVYVFSGAAGLALRDFDAALRLDPAHAHALGGRALANVQTRKPREAVADARACVRLNPGDARQAYNAARVLCQAAACVEADPARPAGAWASASRYRAEAVTLVARAVELTPGADRDRFWADVVRPDTALEPIRKSRPFVEMNARLSADSAAAHSSGGPGQ